MQILSVYDDALLQQLSVQLIAAWASRPVTMHCRSFGKTRAARRRLYLKYSEIAVSR
jgi:hypothetical protein